MVFESAAELDRVVKKFGAVEGLKHTLGRLADYLMKAWSSTLPKIDRTGGPTCCSRTRTPSSTAEEETFAARSLALSRAKD